MMDGANTTMSLAKALGLRPLDRVQISSKYEIGQARAFARFHDIQTDLPYFFFQRVVGDRLEVRSPGGYVALVSPHDVCDVLPGKPVRVMSVTRDAFLQSLKQARTGSKAVFADDDYAPADVLYACKSKWGSVEAHVWFDDETLNDKAPWMAILRSDEAKTVATMARRTVMPVMSRNGGNHSADHGVSQADAYNRRVVKLFMQQSMSDQHENASFLASAGIAPLPLATLNRRFGMGARV
jgi:hypothetical protein